jgi:hypothetical protein
VHPLGTGSTTAKKYQTDDGIDGGIFSVANAYATVVAKDEDPLPNLNAISRGLSYS